MEAKVNFVFVGVFVLVLSTALIAGVLWLSSGKYYRKSYDIYQTYMSESVAGLNLNAPVKYRGVDVGRVRTIALAPENVEQVQLTLDIERGTQDEFLDLTFAEALPGGAFDRDLRVATQFAAADAGIDGHRLCRADRRPPDVEAPAAAGGRAVSGHQVGAFPDGPLGVVGHRPAHQSQPYKR